MSAASFALILIGVLLTLFGVVAQGDIWPRVAFIAIGVAAIFGAGVLQIFERRGR